MDNFDRYVIVFWPVAFFTIFAAFQMGFNAACTSPNFSWYEQIGCVRFNHTSWQGLLLIAIFGLFAFGWVYITKGILPKDEVET